MGLPPPHRSSVSYISSRHLLELSCRSSKDAITSRLQGDRNRSLKHGIIAERRNGQLWPEGQQLLKFAIDRLQEQVGIAPDAASEDDELRIDHRGHGCNCQRQPLRLDLEDSARGPVRTPGGTEDRLDGDRLAHAQAPCLSHDPGGGRRLFETATSPICWG